MSWLNPIRCNPYFGSVIFVWYNFCVTNGTFERAERLGYVGMAGVGWVTNLFFLYNFNIIFFLDRALTCCLVGLLLGIFGRRGNKVVQCPWWVFFFGPSSWWKCLIRWVLNYLNATQPASSDTGTEPLVLGNGKYQPIHLLERIPMRLY